MKRLALGVAIGVVLAGAGVAVASIPDGAGVIHSCRNLKSGALRVIDTDAGQTCAKDEAALTWDAHQPQLPQRIMHDPYERRFQFDVPNDGTMHAFNFGCSEDGRDAVTGVSGLITDDSYPDNHVVPEAPASNLSVSTFGYANSGYVYARGNTADGPVRHIEWDVACAKVVNPTPVQN